METHQRNDDYILVRQTLLLSSEDVALALKSKHLKKSKNNLILRKLCPKRIRHSILDDRKTLELEHFMFSKSAEYERISNILDIFDI